METRKERMMIESEIRKRQFCRELKDLINKYSIEKECDMPDFLLAEMIFNLIEVVGESLKKNLEWISQ